MEWVKFNDFNDENYWFPKDPKIDNYHLAGYYTGDYMLLSGLSKIMKIHFYRELYVLCFNLILIILEWQKTERAYTAFYPMFGFAYKAANTNIKVTLINNDDSTHVVVLDRFMEKVNGDEGEGWHYFLKNLTQVEFLKNAWDSDDKFNWRVSASYII